MTLTLPAVASPRALTPGAGPTAVPHGLAPIPSLLLALAGGFLVGQRRDLSPRARAAATIGGLALIGAAARAPFLESVRLTGTRRRSADIRMSIVVAHPVELVFHFIRDFENFPCIIGALRQVRDHGDGRSHWCASTPTGGTVEWDTETTKYVPNSVIAWQSVAGSPVRMRGLVRLEPEDSSTCLELSIEYQVVDGGLADALVALTTTSRQAEIERDIERLSTYLAGVRRSPTQAPLRS
jgi:uncharacterized membrane protein